MDPADQEECMPPDEPVGQSAPVGTVTVAEPPPSPPTTTTNSMTYTPLPTAQRLSPEEIREIQEDALARAREGFQADLRARDDQLALLTADLEGRRQAEAAATQAAEEAAEAQRRAELTALDRVSELERQQAEQETRWQAELQRRDTILAQERRLSELSTFRQRAISDAGDDVMPHLHDYITGNSEEEIGASLDRARETTQRILGEVQEAVNSQQQAAVASWRATPTAAVTAPAAGGPTDMVAGSRTFSNEELSAMTPGEYAKYRDQLLPLAGGSLNAGQGRGLFQ